MAKPYINYRKEERLKEIRQIAAELKRLSAKTPKPIKYKSNVHPTSDFKPYAGKTLAYFVKTSKKKSVANKFKPRGERQTSLGERLVADWLVKNSIRFKREKEFGDLINPMTGRPLSIDFYLHAHAICIEFDGKQHYKACKMFDRNGDSLEARIQRDKIKDAYCIKRGFNLIRIKYTDINRIDDILKKHFNLTP